MTSPIRKDHTPHAANTGSPLRPSKPVQRAACTLLDFKGRQPCISL